MAQKKKKEKNIKALQRRERKSNRKKISVTQIFIILFSVAMVFMMAFGALAYAY
ncbi:MAG: hypothetical protein IH859_00885 [Chloroflexi bacterium]|nr:hypothetical protein [Chloroflexota bacterium]